MSAKEQHNLYFHAKDRAGNDFLYPMEALQNPKVIMDDELAECIDDATVR
jgi:hypothetical protein